MGHVHQQLLFWSSAQGGLSSPPPHPPFPLPVCACPRPRPEHNHIHNQHTILHTRARARMRTWNARMPEMSMSYKVVCGTQRLCVPLELEPTDMCEAHIIVSKLVRCQMDALKTIWRTG